MKHFTLIIALIKYSIFAAAAPIPGTGSSEVPKALNNILIAEQGFRISNSKTNFWTLKHEIDGLNKNTFQLVGSSPKSRFSINVDKFTKPTDFDSYIKKSVKEYPYFGFEIIKTQVIKVGGQPCYMADLAHLKKNRQMRQFITIKNNMAVVMTCVDEPGQFKETSLQCANLINNFQWADASITTSI